mmetsp:Transcript_81736/g.226393  ORF Transcript_81736/g.226393 Transcript_81736/m.226393 type:complete len:341 (-) Transcript_81736:317-1339(-)
MRPNQQQQQAHLKPKVLWAKERTWPYARCRQRHLPLATRRSLYAPRGGLVCMVDETKLEKRQDVIVLLWVLAGNHCGGSQAFCSQVRICLVLHEQLSHLHLVLHRCQRKGCEAHWLLPLNGCLGVEEHLGNLQVPVLACEVQGSPTGDVRCHDVGASRDQRAHCFAITSVSGPVQWCPGVLVHGVNRCLCLEQHPHRGQELNPLHGALLHLLSMGGKVQRCPAVLVGRVHEARVLGEEHCHLLRPAVTGSQQQRRGLRAQRSARIDKPRVGAPLLEQHRHDLAAAQQHCPMQRRLLVLVWRIDVTLCQKQLKRQLCVVLRACNVERRLQPVVPRVDLAVT